MNSLIIGAVVRGLVTAGSAFIVGRGYATGEEYQTAVGAITGLASILYSVYSRTTNKQIADTVALPDVASVTKTSGKVVTTATVAKNPMSH